MLRLLHARRAARLAGVTLLLCGLTASPAAAQTVKVVTANIDFTSSAKGEQAQVRHVLQSAPDIALLQETRESDLRTIKKQQLPALQRYRIIQFWDQGPFQRASTVLVSKKRFNVGETGINVGYADRPAVDPPARYLPWAVATDAVTGRQIALVSVHMPKASLDPRKPAFTEAYKTMIGNYEGLISSFNQRGISVLTGGDWNQSVAKENPKIDFDPLDANSRVGLQFNWQTRKPCPSTHGAREIIDGIAYTPQSLQIGTQRCLSRLRSDHRPVLAQFGYK